MVNSNSDSIYSWVYQDELGSHGACRREGCGEESESTEHAVCGCKWAQERWRQLEEELTAEWELQEWGDWTAISWLSNHYEGWERVWTAAGAVPRDVELIIGKEFSPQVHSRIMQAANKCAKTAEKIWAERNKENEAWVNSIPELKARKAEADKKQWRHESQQPRAQRVLKRTRIQQKKDDREVHRKAVRVDIENQLREWERSTNEQREGERRLRVSPEELHRVAKKARKSAEQQVAAAHRNIIKKAVMAGTTPNIDMGHAPLVTMADTVPVLSSKRTRNEDAHFWIPKKGTSVRVFWSGIGGRGTTWESRALGTQPLSLQWNGRMVRVSLVCT